MQAVAAASDLPVLTLRSGSVQQAGIPHKGHGDNAAIAQRYAQCVVAKPTPNTRSSAADAKKLIPSLQQLFPVFDHH
jgi:hypothetical protein